jgi:hypothetical protein
VVEGKTPEIRRRTSDFSTHDALKETEGTSLIKAGVAGVLQREGSSHERYYLDLVEKSDGADPAPRLLRRTNCGRTRSRPFLYSARNHGIVTPNPNGGPMFRLIAILLSGGAAFAQSPQIASELLSQLRYRYIGPVANRVIAAAHSAVVADRGFGHGKCGRPLVPFNGRPRFRRWFEDPGRNAVPTG